MQIQDTTNKTSKGIKSSNFESSDIGMDKAEGAEMAAYYLRDKIYTDKPKAVVREYIANAIDEHKIHNISKKAVVKMPLESQASPEFSVRDFAKGLNNDGVRNIFASYFSSTKRDGNIAVGGFGIGAKCAHAYTDSFSVISWHEGIKTVYSLVLEGETHKGKGKVLKLSEEPSDEPSGIEVIVPVKKGDCYKFEKVFKEFAPFVKNHIEVIGSQGDDYEVTEVLGSVIHLKQLKSHSSFLISNNLILCGFIPYTVNLNMLKECETKAIEKLENEGLNTDLLSIVSLSKRWGVSNSVYKMLRVNIGSVDVALNRENIDDTEKTRKTILNSYYSYYKKEISELEKECKKIKNHKTLKSLFNHVFENILETSNVFAAFIKDSNFILKTDTYSNRSLTFDIFEKNVLNSISKKKDKISCFSESHIKDFIKLMFLNNYSLPQKAYTYFAQNEETSARKKEYGKVEQVSHLNMLTSKCVSEAYESVPDKQKKIVDQLRMNNPDLFKFFMFTCFCDFSKKSIFVSFIDKGFSKQLRDNKVRGFLAKNPDASLVDLCFSGNFQTPSQVDFSDLKKALPVIGVELKEDVSIDWTKEPSMGRIPFIKKVLGITIETDPNKMLFEVPSSTNPDLNVFMDIDLNQVEFSSVEDDSIILTTTSYHKTDEDCYISRESLGASSNLPYNNGGDKLISRQKINFLMKALEKLKVKTPKKIYITRRANLRKIKNKNVLSLTQYIDSLNQNPIIKKRLLDTALSEAPNPELQVKGCSKLFDLCEFLNHKHWKSNPISLPNRIFAKANLTQEQSILKEYFYDFFSSEIEKAVKDSVAKITPKTEAKFKEAKAMLLADNKALDLMNFFCPIQKNYDLIFACNREDVCKIFGFNNTTLSKLELFDFLYEKAQILIDKS